MLEKYPNINDINLINLNWSLNRLNLNLDINYIDSNSDVKTNVTMTKSEEGPRTHVKWISGDGDFSSRYTRVFL